MRTISNIHIGKIVLIVDDSSTRCQVLKRVLEEENYHVHTATNGVDAVNKFINHHPDLILLDISMPIMNGYDTARKIKSLPSGNLTPLIFITNENTEQAYIDGVDSGADGVLVRPFSAEVFKAKIKSLRRISDLHRQVKLLQQEQQHDTELAEKLLSGVIESRNFGLDKIGVIKQAAAIFSGDIQLSALCPNGDVNVLLGDFTGHGLRSSIGAIPLTETFRAMTKKGFSLFEIIVQVNKQLYNLLPADLFLAATFISISPHEQSVYILNAGLPDSYIFDADANIKHQISSSHPPLGVLPKLLPDTRLTVYSISAMDRVVLISDGIIEARNQNKEMYGYERFLIAVKQGVLTDNVSQMVLNDINMFCENAVQEDDISLLDIPCGGWEQQFNIEAVNAHNVDYMEDVYDALTPVWKWNLNLTGKRLSSINPIPLAMNQINEIEGAGDHWQHLYTILTELFVNAIDHGVLNLDSGLKNSAEGFSQYYNEREKRLRALDTGYVDIYLEYYLLARGGKMIIKVKDSGAGFNTFKVFKNISDSSNSGYALSGRGVELINRLCDTIEYKENGTLVEATYVWNIK
ncbi:SpoIIE family protein phosphatase [Colwelliaceae bacterium 6471]